MGYGGSNPSLRTMKKLDYRTSVAFLRDKFLPFKDANISIGSSPVLYGLAIYTVFGVVWNKEDKKLRVFRLEDHFKRLQNSAKIMDFHGFLETWTYEKFEKMVMDLIKKNKVEEDALVRVSVFIDENLAGTKIHGLKNSVSAYIYPLGEILPRNGTHIGISKWIRVSSKAIPVRAKVNGSYVNSALMKNEALLNGYQDALALDEKGNICEGTVANVFFVKKGKLITPAVEFDLLEGITRKTIIELAKDLKIKVEERAIKAKELSTFDEVFFCGSSARITPILSIEKKKVGDGKIGKVTEQLMDLYSRILMGEENRYNVWVKLVK
jgi:branched-chain amino acid aminotransferase